MTVKEVEAQTGLARANIRFYEQKGLLAPVRAGNGYRDYTPEDVETLRRIRLLRSLEIGIEEIAAIQRGELPLETALTRCQCVWEERRAQSERAQALCRALRADGAQWATLDAEKYLREAPPQEAPLDADRTPYPFLPVRRYLARMLDQGLFGLLWTALLTLGLGVNMGRRMQQPAALLLDGAVALLLTLLIEPFLLHAFGTTPGKAIFGLRLARADGGRITLAQARRRTLSVLWRGEGWHIPVLSLLCLWKSARACARGEALPWDAESELCYTVRDTSRLRFALWGLARTALACAGALCALAATLPPCRGALTVADFARNYNWAIDFYGLDGARRLSADGAWAQEEGVVIYLGQAGTEAWSFTVDADGRLAEARFEAEQTDGALVSDLKGKALLGALSFAGARANLWSFVPWRLSRALGSDLLSAVDTTLLGVRLRYTVTQRGYLSTLADVSFGEDESAFLHVVFTVTDADAL